MAMQKPLGRFTGANHHKLRVAKEVSACQKTSLAGRACKMKAEDIPVRAWLIDSSNSAKLTRKRHPSVGLQGSKSYLADPFVQIKKSALDSLTIFIRAAIRDPTCVAGPVGSRP